VYAQLGQFVGEPVDGRGESARQRAQRGSRGLCRPAVNQVGNRLGLHQVQFVVEEGALGKLTGVGWPRAEIDNGVDEQ
jgi:hypothetical protein